jgi:hypothetical protein
VCQAISRLLMHKPAIMSLNHSCLACPNLTNTRYG